MSDEKNEGDVSEEEFADVRDAILAHAKKWNRTDGRACSIFDFFLQRLAKQSNPPPGTKLN